MANKDDRSERLHDLHNQGEKDASEGKYEQPHGELGIIGDVMTGAATEQELREENKAYDAGHNNAWKQR